MRTKAVSILFGVTCSFAVACGRSESAPEVGPTPAPTIVVVPPAAPSGATTVTGATDPVATATATATATGATPAAKPVAASTPTAHVATVTAAPVASAAPSHSAHAGGVGTCTAMRLDGSLIGLEIAPTSQSGLSHDYVACRAKLEPRIKAAVCAGKTSGTGSYLYKIGGNAATKNAILCR